MPPAKPRFASSMLIAEDWLPIAIRGRTSLKCNQPACV